MVVSPEEAELRVECLKSAFRERGFKLTHQRLEVVREIAGTDSHPDVETIYRGVRERVPTISLDTVYRTLATLTDSGLVTRVTGITGPARYDANAAHHHHFICTRCGLVHDISNPGNEPLDASSEVMAVGTVETVEVQFKGVCRSCAQLDGS